MSYIESVTWIFRGENALRSSHDSRKRYAILVLTNPAKKLLAKRQINVGEKNDPNVAGSRLGNRKLPRAHVTGYFRKRCLLRQRHAPPLDSDIAVL